MNNYFKVLFCAICLGSQQSKAHQPREAGGLFDAIYKQQKAFTSAQPVFEFVPTGEVSNVRIIQGFNDINKHVFQASCQRPIILKISMASCDYPDSVPANHLEMNSIFQEIASCFGKSIGFASMRLCSHERFGVENLSILSQLFAQNKISSLINASNMPFILFFHNGQLYQPTHLPTAILSGFYNKENLTAFIQKKFFTQSMQNRPEQGGNEKEATTGFDLTTTTSVQQTGHCQKTQVSKKQSTQPKETKKGFLRRFWQNLSN